MSTQLLDRAIRKDTFPNGISVLTEEMPHVRSVSVGVWVDAGSRHEDAVESGISHFVEHMVFKGTTSRSAEDIACEVDSMGGNLDAFTTKEGVAFAIKVMDEHLPRAFDIVSDMVRNPTFQPADIEKEKGVILEELKMDEDNPEYLLHEIFSGSFWKGHPLGRPIIGTRETIDSFGQYQVRRFFEHTYNPRNFLVTAAGNLRHDALAALVEEKFGAMSNGRERGAVVSPEPNSELIWHDKPSLEQVHLALAVPAIPIADPRRFAAYVLNTALGGGASSRLFLKIREQEGLVYTVYSDMQAFSDNGCMMVYAGTALDALPKVVEYVLAEFRDLKARPLPDAELRRAKDHLKGSLMLSLESTSSRMGNLARQEKYFGRVVSLDEIIESIENVTAGQVAALANEWFHQERIAMTVLGSLDGFKFGRELLAC